jgi:diguanylate cyclase (GGDEF)-like protein
MAGSAALLSALAGLALGVGLGGWLAQRFFRRRLERALDAARRDPLTGLGNRRAFDEQLAIFLRVARRYGTPLALALFDIDHLKQINDRFGHAAGDVALVHFGRVLLGSIRESDVTARIGGDEFALLLPQTDAQGAEALVSRFLESLAKIPCEWPNSAGPGNPAEPGSAGKPIAVLASAGIAQFQDDPTPAALFERADKSLYDAKHSPTRLAASTNSAAP